MGKRAPGLEFVLRPIGVMRSPYVVHHDAPRQPCAGTGVTGEIVLAQGMQNGLKDLAGFSHVWVLFWCQHTRGWKSQLVPPRDSQKRGVFATRSPSRPNPIGLSCLRLLSVQKRVLKVGDHDLLDGTPILDVKPYLPYCDSVPDAVIGYADKLAQDASDHRAWWEQKGLPPPRIYRQRRAPASGSGKGKG